MEPEEIQSESARRIIQKLREIEEAQKREDDPQPKKRSWLSAVMPFFLVLVLLAGSFWLSFMLGKRILIPVKPIKTDASYNSVQVETVSPERLEAALKKLPPDRRLNLPLTVESADASSAVKKLPLVVAPEPKKMPPKKPQPVVSAEAKTAAKLVVPQAKAGNGFWPTLWQKVFPPKSKSESEYALPETLDTQDDMSGLPSLEASLKMIEAENTPPRPIEKTAEKMLVGKPYSAHQSYAVQSGVFRIKSNADNLVSQLSAKGLNASMSKWGSYWRVLVGESGSRAQAQTLKISVQNAGFDAIIIRL